jgi:hypothetical protein
MHAHAEHEQDHADVGHLRGDASVGYKSGCMRADGNPGQQVPDEAREPETSRDGAEDQGSGQSTSEREDEGQVVHPTTFLKPLPKGSR